MTEHSVTGLLEASKKIEDIMKKIIELKEKWHEIDFYEYQEAKPGSEESKKIEEKMNKIRDEVIELVDEVNKISNGIRKCASGLEEVFGVDIGYSYNNWFIWNPKEDIPVKMCRIYLKDYIEKGG